MAIKYFLNADIDKKKWDDCIAHSYNGLIYSTTSFLDNMASNWDALILDDYVAVMPLPYRKKYGIHYVYPPAFSQQLGITSLQQLNADDIRLFLKNIPQKFRYVVMNFHTENNLSWMEGKIRENYFLSLNNPFSSLEKNFSRSAIRNVRKANSENIIVKDEVKSSDIIQLHRERFKDEVGANVGDYENLQSLFDDLLQKKMLFTLGAFHRQQLIAGSIYFVYKNRITFIINGNNKQSLENGATHFLMYETIKKFANTNMVLDFEGSDFAEFVRFYKQYGAEKEEYVFLKINKLPWPFSLLKK